jgi:prepilin-type N-terminal cleavage/methylation domain-containing protein
MQSNKGQSGFTLVELVVVMVMVGIVSYFAVAKIVGNDTEIKTTTALDKIAADVRFAQQLAVSESREVRVYIDQSNNKYYLKYSDDSYVSELIGGGNFVVQFGSGEFKGVQIASTGFSGGRLDFDSRGDPSNNGTSFTGEKTLVTIGSKSLKVRAGSGMVRVD